MSCETWKDPIALHAGGNLSPTEAAALERHLRDCPACRRYGEEMAASQKALRRVYEGSFEDLRLARLRRNVLKRIADGQIPGRRRRPRSVVRWLALAASLTFVVSLWLVQDLREPPDDPRPKAARRPDAGLPELPVPPPPAPSPPLQAASPALPAPRGDTPPADRIRGAPDSDLAPASSEPSPSSTLLVLPPRPETTSPPGPVLLDVTVPSAAAPGPRLRRLSETTDYTIYWLETPADTLKEKEDATTKIL